MSYEDEEITEQKLPLHIHKSKLKPTVTQLGQSINSIQIMLGSSNIKDNRVLKEKHKIFCLNRRLFCGQRQKANGLNGLN